MADRTGAPLLPRILLGDLTDHELLDFNVNRAGLDGSFGRRNIGGHDSDIDKLSCQDTTPLSRRACERLASDPEHCGVALTRVAKVSTFIQTATIAHHR